MQATPLNACDWKQRCFKRKVCLETGNMQWLWKFLQMAHSVKTQVRQGGVQRNSNCTHMVAWPPASGWHTQIEKSWTFALAFGFTWTACDNAWYLGPAVQGKRWVSFSRRFAKNLLNMEMGQIETLWMDLTQSTSHIYQCKQLHALAFHLNLWLQHVIICSCHDMHVHVNHTYIHRRFAFKQKNQFSIWVVVFLHRFRR